MLEKLRTFIDRIRLDDRAMRRLYIGCTVGALLLSAGILAAIAHGERSRASDVAASPPSTAPSPVLISSAPDEGEELPLVVTIDDKQATTLIKLALRSSLAPESVEVRFAAPDTLNIDATVSRESVRDYLRSEGQNTVAALLALAPSTLELKLELGISVDGDGLVVSAKSFTACGLAVSDYLPDSILATASSAISSSLPDTSALKGVEVRDGSAVFTLGL